MSEPMGIKKFNGDAITAFAFAESQLLGADFWRVMAPLSFFFTWKGVAYSVDIPMGYLTDGASVPKPFHPLVGPWGSHGPAAIAHDIMCEYLKIWDISRTRMVDISRKDADDIFNEIMKVCGVDDEKRALIYAAVRTYAVTTGRTRPSAMYTAAKRNAEANWVKDQEAQGKRVPVIVHYGATV